MNTKPGYYKEKPKRKDYSFSEYKTDYGPPRKDVKSSPYASRYKRGVGDRTPPRFRTREGFRSESESYDEDVNSPETDNIDDENSAVMTREFVPSEGRRNEGPPKPDAKPFSDDSRLSKLVRRLCREDDRERRITTAKQLQEIMPIPENVKVIVRNSDALLLLLHDVLYERTYKEVKQEAAQCISLVGQVMGTDAHRYFHWVFNKIQAAHTGEGKVMLINALLDTLQSEHTNFNEFIPMVLSNCQGVIENADRPDVLTAIVNVLVFISEEYSHAFRPHFRDTVDILVGWHIDATQKDHVIEMTSQSLISLHPFWVEDMGFSMTLLGQFLEDMEAYSEDLGFGLSGKAGLDDDMPSPQECIIKIAALLRVFTTVAQSLGDHFHPDKGAGVTWEYLLDVATRIIQCIENTIKSMYNEKVLFTANKCLLLLCSTLGGETSQLSKQLLAFIVNQLHTHRRYSNHFLLSLFALIQKTVELIGTQLPEKFIGDLYSEQSYLHHVRYAHARDVLAQLIKITHVTLNVKNVALMEETYRYILGDMEIAFNRLLELCEFNKTIQLVKENPYKALSYSSRQAEASLIFNICALAEIGNNKSNIIGMWALTPSVFELLSQHLLKLDPLFLEQYPAVYFALLQTLYSHCSRHGNFITSSNLITQHTVLEGSLLANVSSQTGERFSTILALLADILNTHSTPYDSRCLALKWSLDIVEALNNTQNVYMTIDCDSLIEALVASGYSTETEIVLKVCDCLKSYLFHANTVSESLLRQCLDLCNIKMSAIEGKVKNAYTELLKQLPLDVSSRKRDGVVHKASKKRKTVGRRGTPEAFSLARRYHMTKTPMGTFHSHNFRAVMGFILENIKPSALSEDDWLEKIFFSSQRIDKEVLEPPPESINLATLISNNSSLLWFWATWEAAQFCTLAKLRTPLGKPQDTFMSIEAALKRYVAQVKQKKAEQNLANGDAEPEKESEKEETDLDFNNLLTRVNVLLQFMENLEKLLYNAYEGCALAMVAPPKVVRTFFRTNRSTCQEWLLRIRLCVMIIAEHCNEPAVVVRHAWELMRDMQNSGNTQGTEMERVLVLAVQALVRLRCPEAIHGMYAWCKDVVGRKVNWMKGAIEMAAGRYETGVLEYRSALRLLVHPDPNQPLTAEVKKEERSRSTSSSPLGSPSQGSFMEHAKISIMSKNKDPPPASSTSNTSSSSNDIEPVLARTFTHQICDAYMRLGSHEEVLKWQDTLTQYQEEVDSEELKNALILSLDANYIRALSHFEDGDLLSVRDNLAAIPGVSLTSIGQEQPKARIPWNPGCLLEASQKNYMRAVTLCGTSTDFDNDMNQASDCLEWSLELCEVLRTTQCLAWPVSAQQHSLSYLYGIHACHSQLQGTTKPKSWMLPLSSTLKLDANEHDVGAWMQALSYVRAQHIMQDVLNPQKSADFEGVLSKLEIATARLARKQQNFMCAEKLLIDEIQGCLSTQPTSDSESFETIGDALEKLRVNNGTSASVLKLVSIEREGAKLIHDKGKPRDAIEELASSTVTYADVAAQYKSIQHKDMVASCLQLNARSLVTLVSWLQHDPKYLAALASQVKHIGQGDESAMSKTAQNLKILLELEHLGASKEQGLFRDSSDHHACDLADNPILSESEAVVGRLLHYSTMQCPSLSKSWFSLASWCYKWGRKSVDNAVHGSIELSAEEKKEIMELLPRGTSDEETEAVLAILSQLNTRVSAEEDISDQDQTLYDDGTETTRKQLLGSCLSLQIASDACLDSLIDVWRGVVRRVYHYYQLSAKAYFTYLNLNGQSYGEETNMDGNITATLRLLRLLVKHAWELRGVLERGLANTPTVPWKGIIPQLFSRLSHPEAYVRQSVSELLCRVAQDAPHLIVYPAVVGASANEKLDNEAKGDGILNEYLAADDEAGGDENEDRQSQDEDDEAADNAGSDDMLKNCFTAIVDTLANSNPRMISEVQLLVSELRRITLLWEELWLGTLNQHHQDVTRRLNQLDNEVKKVMTNVNLTKDEKTAIIKEKHNTVLKPTLYTMERLAEITSASADTPNEKWFQDTYAKPIQDALKRLKEPNNPATPQASWQLFKQLHHSLQQKAQKRSSLVLSMEEISDKLSQLKHTVIAMPGISTAGQQVVTIESVQNTVHILPTKTKPKKMVLLGSDGRKYPYLFKGLEDLHLDERIMQFLSIVNNMFAKANRGDRKLYHARHYSVTPLGARSGLIQWVDGATPLFSLYKRWQQREALAQQLKTQPPGSSTAQANQPNIPRPSEVFYKKLMPLLKKDTALSVDKSSQLDNRKDWPLSIMRKVLEDLMYETPGDLLAKELWCCSTSASEWWRITQTYNRSTAVMSVIGYIIGLGDRHLDNVLVDLHSGEVVHIDYNVCFEKGKGLRVPERVPFRMTQNLETALGVTGVEGLFRLSCEYVLKTMRKGRETLLTLLEAFVYDPLVDWTTGNEAGYTGAFYGGGHSVSGAGDSKKNKKQMEREITRSMFAIRVAEMRGAWLKNRDEMLVLLPKLKEAVSQHLTACNALGDLEDNTEKYRHQIMYLEEAKDDTIHPLYSLLVRYTDFAVVRETRLAVQKDLQEKLGDCEHWYKAHSAALTAVQNGHLQHLVSSLAQAMDLGVACFMPVLDFLNSAGQQSLASQCEQASAELNTALLSRRGVLRSCVDVLHTYATMVTHFPPTFVEENRNTRWQQWLQDIVCDFSSTRVVRILDEFDELYGLTRERPLAQRQAARGIHTRLQRLVQDNGNKLLKLMERRSGEGVELTSLEETCSASMSDVHSFMREQGREGVSCMTSVVISVLCSLCKRYLTMETAAGAAADRLMDLTSREGDWFLDELCSMSANVNHLLQALNDPALCHLQSADMCQKITSSMKATDSVYTSLQELNVNFRTIIVPETVKSIECNEPSVVSSLDALDRIIAASPRSLDNLVSTLEKQLMNAIMGLETADEECVTAVRKMRVKYDELLQGSNPETTALTPGQMLLMGFNGLFTRLDAEFHSMLDLISKVTGPDIWRKVDVIKEARSIQLTAFNESTLGILTNIFFVRQMKAMQSFFAFAKQHASTLQGTSGSSSLHDDEHLAKPIKFFIAEYVRKHMIGLPSQTLGHILCHYVSALHVDVTAEIELRDIGAECKVSLEELCKKAIESNLKNGVFEHIHLTQATTLISSSDAAWRKCDLVRRLDNNIAVLQSSCQRLQLQLARYQWLFEDDVNVSPSVLPNRVTIMAELGKSVQNLMAFEVPVTTVLEKHAQLESSVTQRLKWGAGANPTLSAVLREFEGILLKKDSVMQSEAGVVTEVISTCNSILHFEALRTNTPEAVSADASFLALLNKVKQACDLAESCDTSVTEIEEGLTQSVTIPEVASSEWIEESLDLVTSHITALAEQQTSLEENQAKTKETVSEHVNTITSVLTSHHKLMSDVRSILKSLAKQEEHELGVEVFPGGIRHYVNTYKTFSENLTTLLKLAANDEFTPSLQDEIHTLISTLTSQIRVIYGDLVAFAPPLKPDKTTDADTASPLNFANILKRNSETNLASPKKGGLLISRTELLTATPSSAASSQQIGMQRIGTPGKKPEKIVRDPKTGKAVQEKNSYAVGVWRRVKMKLDGRDPDQTKRASVPEQVDFIIREATSLDNLAVLYEGWTPWV